MDSIEKLREGKFTIDRLMKEIKERHKLTLEMVGCLYPGILADEIREIYLMIDELKTT